MKWRSVYQEAAGYLELVVLGNPTCSELDKMVEERRIKLQRLKCTKTLFDFTSITSMLTTFEIYRLPGEIERMDVKRVNRTASVVPVAFWREFKLMETLAQEQGYDLRMFDDRDAAINYLVAATMA